MTSIILAVASFFTGGGHDQIYLNEMGYTGLSWNTLQLNMWKSGDSRQCVCRLAPSDAGEGKVAATGANESPPNRLAASGAATGAGVGTGAATGAGAEANGSFDAAGASPPNRLAASGAGVGTGATTGAGTKAGGANSGRQKIRSKYGGGTNGTGLILSDENNMDMENVPATAAADALGQVEARSKDAASLINVQQQVSEEENEDEDIEAMLDNAKEDPGEGGVHRADHHGDHHGDHRGDRRHAIGSVENYDPNFLDDGTIKQGKSRLITSGPSHRHSFLPYVKRSNLKDEINAQFRELHPWLPTSMSLSKIRTLKRESLEQWKKNDLELSTLALGIVYFERLVIKTLVMKTNRKLKFAACLFIAFKFNVGELRRDFMTTDDEIIESSDLGVTSPAAMQRVLESIEKSLLISRKDLFKIELQVFAELDFNLSIPPEKLMPHFMRLLDTLDLTPREYLGGKRMRMLFDDEDEDDEPENIIENLLSEKHLSKVGGGGGGGGISSSAEDPAAVYSDLSDAIIL